MIINKIHLISNFVLISLCCADLLHSGKASLLSPPCNSRKFYSSVPTAEIFKIYQSENFVVHLTDGKELICYLNSFLMYKQIQLNYSNSPT